MTIWEFWEYCDFCPALAMLQIHNEELFIETIENSELKGLLLEAQTTLKKIHDLCEKDFQSQE